MKLHLIVISYIILNLFFNAFSQEVICENENQEDCQKVINLDPNKLGQVIYINSTIDNEYNQGRPIDSRYIPLLTLVEHPFENNYYALKICFAHNPNQISINTENLACNGLGEDYEEDLKYYSIQSIQKAFSLLKHGHLMHDIGTIALNGFLLPFAFTKIFKIGAAAKGIQVAYQVGVDLAFFQLIDLEYFGNGNAMDLGLLDGVIVLKTVNNIDINEMAGDLHDILKGDKIIKVSGNYQKMTIKAFACKNTPNITCEDFKISSEINTYPNVYKKF